MRMTFLYLFFTVSLFANCKKNSSQPNLVKPEDTLIVIEPPVSTGDFIDKETPAGVQPYMLDANNQPIGNVTTADAPKGYTIVFSDEFNSSTLDSKQWNITVSEKSRAERPEQGINAWFWKPDQVSLDGTSLILKAYKQSTGTMYCGAVDSKGKFEPKFGYLEARIDNADITKAVHTAFWLQGANMGNVDGTGNDGCEVDIFESAYIKGSHTQTALHWDGYGDAKQGWTKHWDNGISFGDNIHTGYHVIALEWTPRSMSFYYDGKRMFDYSGVGLPLVKEFLWLSVGASFGDGDFKSRDIGMLTQAKVDWVRVYAKKP